MRKILLIGKNGQVGWELNRTLLPLGEVMALDYPEIDLSKPQSLRAQLADYRADLIINAAAYTNVDKAESEPELARAINAHSVAEMAALAREWNAPLIHYSTDYVFDGAKGSPYTEDDIPNPLNMYGQTKLEGEQAVQASGCAYWIFRTAWVYSLRQGGFVQKVLQWAREKETLRIVDDQVSNPTWARMLAEATAQVVAMGREDWSGWAQEKGGLYHLAGGGYCSRFEWAREILRLDTKKEEQVVKELLPASSSEFPTPAKRPLHSILDCLNFESAMCLMRHQWKKDLHLALNQS
jgi:dTDP-4-dehydrorhamnose reductase